MDKAQVMAEWRPGLWDEFWRRLVEIEGAKEWAVMKRNKRWLTKIDGGKFRLFSHSRLTFTGPVWRKEAGGSSWPPLHYKPKRPSTTLNIENRWGSSSEEIQQSKRTASNERCIELWEQQCTFPHSLHLFLSTANLKSNFMPHVLKWANFKRFSFHYFVSAYQQSAVIFITIK